MSMNAVATAKRIFARLVHSDRGQEEQPVLKGSMPEGSKELRDKFFASPETPAPPAAPSLKDRMQSADH